MKKHIARILVGLVALCVCVLIATCLLNNKANAHFGYADHVYAPTHTSPELGGRADLIDIEMLIHDISSTTGGPFLSVNITSQSKGSYALGYYRVTDGIIDRDASKQIYGKIEVLNADSWEYVGDICPRLTGEFSNIEVTDTVFFSFPFPLHVPGEYKLTYYFREIHQSDSLNSTGSDLYEVSHTYFVPEATTEKYDVVDVQPCLAGNEKLLTVVLRANDGEIPYIDLAATVLEIQAGDTFIEAMPPDGEESAVLQQYTEQDSPIVRYRQNNFDLQEWMKVFDNVNAMATPVIPLYIEDLDAEHRLTLEFVENPDGTGERYTLQLRLKFSEE